jgi:hypothetical protein
LRRCLLYFKILLLAQKKIKSIISDRLVKLIHDFSKNLHAAENSMTFRRVRARLTWTNPITVIACLLLCTDLSVCTASLAGPQKLRGRYCSSSFSNRKMIIILPISYSSFYKEILVCISVDDFHCLHKICILIRIIAFHRSGCRPDSEPPTPKQAMDVHMMRVSRRRASPSCLTRIAICCRRIDRRHCDPWRCAGNGGTCPKQVTRSPQWRDPSRKWKNINSWHINCL